MILLNAVALVFVLGGLGLTFGLLLAFLGTRIAVKSDPRVELVEEELPKGQCGSCGFAGCRQYAEAVVGKPDVAANLCTPGGNPVAKVVAQITGKAAAEVEARKAVVQCQGTRGEVCVVKFLYEGLEDCNAAAQLYHGDKACEFSCLGYGNCQKVCPSGAIAMSPHQMPVVDAAACTGCGVCVEACPRDVISLVPTYAKSYIQCRNTEKGAITKKDCSAGCLGCGICERSCPENAMWVEDNLAGIDHSKCKDCAVPVCLVMKCAPGSIVPFYGVERPNVEPPKPRPPAKKPAPAKATKESAPAPKDGEKPVATA